MDKKPVKAILLSYIKSLVILWQDSLDKKKTEGTFCKLGKN